MADIHDRNVNTAFTGLLTTVAIFGGVGAICLIGFETLRQFRRLPNVHFTRFWRDPKRDVGGGIDGQEDDEEGKVKGLIPNWNNGRWGLGTRNTKDGGKGKLTCEDWEMGHLYLARMFHATTPSPPLARWPLAWTWQALKFDDWFYASHTGMDTVVYVRYLRALVYYMTLHTLTTAPLLLGINLKFSKGASYDDMSAASISFLVTIPDESCTDPNSADCNRTPNNEGRSLLWIHLCMMYWISITWIIGLWWIGRGSLKIRSRLIEETRKKRMERKRKEKEEKDRNYDENENEGGKGNQSGNGNEHNDDSGFDVNVEMMNAHGLGGKESEIPEDDDEGWRQRTLMVLNLPTTMRDEASIRRYFEEFLRPDDDGSIIGMDINSSQNGLEQQGIPSSNSNLSVSASNRGGKTHSRRSQSEESNVSAMGESTGMMDAHGAHEGDSTYLNRQKSLVRSDRGLLRPDSPQDEEDPNSSSNANMGPVGPEPDTDPDRHLRSPVQTVVLVRKMNELSAMLTRRQEVLAQLEAAHIKLAKNVMTAVGKRTSKMRSKNKDEGGGGMGGVGNGELDGKALKMEAKITNQLHGSDETKNTADSSPRNNQDVEKEAVEKSRKQLEEEALEDLTRRLVRFSPNNKGRHGREAQMRGDETEDEMNVMAETVWESLATVPRELLDPFQPATRLSALFRGQTVPTIDYLLTKLNLLTALVTEMRARPPSSYEPTSTAFVTFRDPRQARMVWRELKSQIVVRVRLAPEVKDLDWERLMRTSFTGDLARGLGVNAFFWGLTIFWIIPIQLLTSVLFSVKNLKLVFPPVEDFFKANPGIEAFVSVTLPTVLVSLITMAVPEIIFQISKRAQGFVTFSALYDQCLCRYWKFIICNVVIFFCIGVTTIETILQQVVLSGDLLLTIAFSFPAAAPFYVSYLILGISLHSGFELFGFMVPLIQHIGARKAFTPRARALKTLPRNFNRYYWLPFHTLIATIVFIFAILNPLVIPFALVYLFVAMIVFKKNFAYVYFRRFNEKDGVVYFTRLLRFSLDGLLVGQIVIIVFFAVTNQRAVYIGLSALLTPFTVAFKLFGTRLWASQSRALDDEEANALCGINVNYAPVKGNGTEDQGQGGSHFSTASRSDGSPLDARARGRFPQVLPAPSTGSAFYRAWHKVHDSFNANGHDKSSYVATAHARGQQLANPVQFGAKSLAHAPLEVVKQTAGNANHFKNALTHTFGRNKDYEKKEDPEAVAVREAEEAVVASQDLLSMAAAGDAEFKEEKELKAKASKEEENVSNLRSKSQRRRPSRRGSTRSENRPFLSGADAVLMNAPVEHDSGDLSFNYGDEAGYEARMARTPSGTPRRSSRRGSTYRSPPGFHQHEKSESGYLADDRGRRLSEFGHLVPARESEELRDANRAKSFQDEEDDEEDEDEDEDAQRDLVSPHANVRWDDTPSNSARYNNPFYNTELDPFLWLPRDPLGIVDLYDTIEWHGAAFVSSQGGQGHVGEWDEEDEEESEFAEKGQFDDGSDDEGALDAIHGNEQIILTGTLARHLEEAEDVEEVPDPAASLPRGVLADYKKAIRRGSQMDESQDDSSTIGRNHMNRQGSVMSHASFRSPTLSARMRVDDGDGDRPPSPIDLRSSPTNALRPVASNERDQYRQKSTKRKDTAGSIPAFDLSSPTDQPHSTPAESTASPISPAPAPALAPTLHFDEAQVAGHDQKASTHGPSRPSNRLPSSNEQRVFSSPAAGVSFQTPAPQGVERNTVGGSSHFRYGTGASGMSGASLRSGATSVGNRTISMKKALQAEVMEEERRLLLKEKLGTVKRKTAFLKGTTHKLEAEKSEELKRGDTIMSRHERALERRQGARSEVGSTYDPTEQQSPTSHTRVSSARESQTPRASRFLLRDMSFSRTPRSGQNPHGNVDGSNLQMQELNAAGLANSARSKAATLNASRDQSVQSTPTPANHTSASKRPTTLFLGDQSNYQYTDFGLQASPTSYKAGSNPATGRQEDQSPKDLPSSPSRPEAESSDKKD